MFTFWLFQKQNRRYLAGYVIVGKITDQWWHNQISIDEEEERAQLLKQRRLATAEILRQNSSKKGETKEEEGNDGFISQLTTKIVDNLQVSIKNIHLRFEDNVSDPGHPFAAGITLKELSAVSTDGDWKPTFISEMTSTIHKVGGVVFA